MFMRRYLLLFLITLIYLNGLAQDTLSVSNDSIIEYRYSSGKISSKGAFKDGVPHGIWHNYYENGKLKSKGYYNSGVLQGDWFFYDKNDSLIMKMAYDKGYKHGKRYLYKPDEIVEEYFKQDVKEGLTHYYSRKPYYLSKSIPYKNGSKHGLCRIYNKKGIVVEIVEYKNDKTISIQYINRSDKQGNKQGKWIQFYANGNIKSEGLFLNNKRNGIFKYYDLSGKLLKIEKYQNDILLKNDPEIVDLEERIDYHSNRKPSRIEHYKDSVKHGFSHVLDEKGNILESTLYLDGQLAAKGRMDTMGLKQDQWKEFRNSKIIAEGSYKDGKRIGKWIFYHDNGKIEQIGNYNSKGLEIGEWQWFFPSGDIIRLEEYENGLRNGIYYEFDESGDTIARGNFIDDKEDGFWMIRYGDYIEKGNYTEGLKNGLWRSFYMDGTIYFKGKFIDGNPDGKHEYFYPNGSLKEVINYSGYKRNGNSLLFDINGNLIFTVNYKDDREIEFESVTIEKD